MTPEVKVDILRKMEDNDLCHEIRGSKLKTHEIPIRSASRVSFWKVRIFHCSHGHLLDPHDSDHWLVLSVGDLLFYSYLLAYLRIYLLTGYYTMFQCIRVRTESGLLKRCRPIAILPVVIN